MNFKESSLEYEENKKSILNLPSFSLLLPVLNEESQIIGLLENMCNLIYNGNVEILLLDDGSSDSTLEKAMNFQKKLPQDSNRKLKIIQKPNPNLPSKGKFENLNRGLENSNGEIIGIFDADARLEEDSLTKVAFEFSNSTEHVVGIQIPWKHRNKDESWLTKVFVTGIDIHQQIMQKGRSEIGVMIPTYGSGEFWKKSALQLVEGWNDVITEDIELSYRIQLLDKKVKLIFSTYSNQLAPNTLSNFIQQQERWAAGFFQTFKRLGPKILTSEISKKGKLDSILLMLFYGLPAITYINFLLFCVLGLLYNYDPLLQREISFLVLTCVLLLGFGLVGSIFIQGIIFYQKRNDSIIKSLFWSIWLSLTGLVLAPFFFKAMINGLIKKKLTFHRTPKNSSYNGSRISFSNFSLKTTSVFMIHIVFIVGMLIYTYSILPFIMFVSISGYLFSLLLLNVIFIFISIF
ncbi:MAG: glycosyltransferase [Candidatus Thorarchaeota archaeon]